MAARLRQGPPHKQPHGRGIGPDTAYATRGGTAPPQPSSLGGTPRDQHRHRRADGAAAEFTIVRSSPNDYCRQPWERGLGHTASSTGDHPHHYCHTWPALAVGEWVGNDKEGRQAHRWAEVNNHRRGAGALDQAVDFGKMGPRATFTCALCGNI